MGLTALLQSLWLRHRGSAAARAEPCAPGTRVRLRTPLASRQTVWIPAGATGIVVGADPSTRQVSIELDSPRTVVTVPWSWIEDAHDPPRGPAASGGPTPAQ